MIRMARNNVTDLMDHPRIRTAPVVHQSTEPDGSEKENSTVEGGETSEIKVHDESRNISNAYEN